MYFLPNFFQQKGGLHLSRTGTILKTIENRQPPNRIDLEQTTISKAAKSLLVLLQLTFT